MKLKDLHEATKDLTEEDTIEVIYVAIEHHYREVGKYRGVTDRNYLRLQCRPEPPSHKGGGYYTGRTAHHYSKIKSIKKVEEE